MKTNLDHLVVAARDLEAGREYICEMLGVDVPIGGEHKMMGTHNRVMTLGGGVYLEIIAISPDLQAPEIPRWFGLDDPAVRESIAQKPKLLTWAVNTDDLNQLVSGSAIPLGQIAEAQRDNLKWKVALTEDGRLPAAGFLPLSIQWLVDFHPSTRMADLDCRLEKLLLHHPRAAWLRSALASIGITDQVEVVKSTDHDLPRLQAVIKGPGGVVSLCSS